MRNESGRGLRFGSTVVVLVCAASAGAHAGLVPAHLGTDPRLGAAFLVAVALLLGAVIALAMRPRDAWVFGGVMLLLSGLVAAYLASRTTGIPVLDPEPEAVDPVGVATALVEATGFVFALLTARGRHGRPVHLQEVTR